MTDRVPMQLSWWRSNVRRFVPLVLADATRLVAIPGATMIGVPSAFAQDAVPAGVASGGSVPVGPVVMAPHPWQMTLQDGHSPVKLRMEHLNWIVSGLMTLVVVFVALLMLYVLFRFHRSRHKVSSVISHNTPLEVAWTIAPALMLMVIAIPSISLLYFEDRTQHADMTVKVTGHQWYWEYGYPDQNVRFDSYPIPQDQLKPGQLRLLDVDNQLVVPVGKNIRVLTSSADVIHSFFIPSLGVQRYAIPGQVIETWFSVDKPGTYYGECNQICGTNHSFMPISVRALSPEDFQVWLSQAKTKYSSIDQSGARLADLRR